MLLPHRTETEAPLLPVGAEVALLVGLVLGMLALLALVWWVVRRSRR